MSQDLLITNVRPMAGPATDLLIRGGRIAALGSTPESEGTERIDGAGAILLPGLVECHTHLDKSLLGMDWYRNEGRSSLADIIENERAMRRKLGIDPERQASRQIVASLALGTTHIRSHVDVDTDQGLAAVEGVLAAREAYRAVMDVELVVFPQSGLLVRPGTHELMEAALKLGAEVVGGLDPAGFDRDPKGHLDAVFGLAERHGKAVDIHLHEPGELGAFSTELIVERTLALGMQGRVTISHAFCLGMPESDRVAYLVELLAGAQIHIATTGPAAWPAPPVKQLRQAGVTVAAGSDGLRDLWSPYGNGDMLERAMLIALRNDFRSDEDLELALEACTSGGAKVMGLADYGLEVGCRADLVLAPGKTPADLVVSRPARRLVLKAGRIVARDGKALVEAP